MTKISCFSEQLVIKNTFFTSTKSLDVQVHMILKGTPHHGRTHSEFLNGAGGGGRGGRFDLKRSSKGNTTFDSLSKVKTLIPRLIFDVVKSENLHKQ